MSYAQLGNATSGVEVVDIAPGGIWLLVDGEEFFLGFGEFPWFRSASIEKVFNVERVGVDHLFWPNLDVDLHLDSIREPAKFPLVSKSGA